jgi:RHH-type proline utilization regulon transcriptional repressor/proline dehydrogenase/delta 1-pyrroline-5-carboxylate dehydrogenase
MPSVSAVDTAAGPTGDPTTRPAVDPATLEREIAAVGRALAAGQRKGVRPRAAMEDRGMAMLGGRPELRAALFRLIDVAPACRDWGDLGSHLSALLRDAGDPLGGVGRLSGRPGGRIAGGLASRGVVRAMASRFIVGADPVSGAKRIGRLWRDGAASSVDLLGEATLTFDEADHYEAKCHEALDALAAAARTWPEQPGLESDRHGPLPRVNLSVKVSALTPLNRPDAPELAAADAAGRLRGILRHARDVGAHVHVDAESLDWRDAVTMLVLELLAEEEFAAGPSIGMVLQAYLNDVDDQIDTVLAAPGVRGRRPPLTIRLVKGAYWDHELVDAEQNGWTPPVFLEKRESDRSFERATRRLLDERDTVRLAVASHNLRSVAHAIAYNRLTGGDDRDIEIQVLRGLGEPMLGGVRGLGLRCRVYCPVGDLVAGMAYLVRRLLENSANESFLAQQAKGADLDALLAAP